ncbi:hypothetical protein L6494_28330 (plasmid) [Nostoc sp. UHCC 0870]|nr:hypothetical protein L6494_28330 [Nostoc sp. UHCC 0870]
MIHIKRLSIILGGCLLLNSASAIADTASVYQQYLTSKENAKGKYQIGEKLLGRCYQQFNKRDI